MSIFFKNSKTLGMKDNAKAWLEDSNLVNFNLPKICDLKTQKKNLTIKKNILNFF